MLAFCFFYLAPNLAGKIDASLTISIVLGYKSSAGLLWSESSKTMLVVLVVISEWQKLDKRRLMRQAAQVEIWSVVLWVQLEF